MRKKIIFTVSILFIAFIAVEAILRVWLFQFASPGIFSRLVFYEETPSYQRKYSPHPYLNYGLTPGYRSRFSNNKHNSLGYRGDEISALKTEGVFRIVAIGGSTTYTAMVEDYRSAYPFLLQEILREKYGYRDVEVINAGVGGYSTHENLINLAFRVLDLDPDMVIIHEGINDVHSRLVLPSSYRGDNSGRRKQWTPFKPNLLQQSILFRMLNVWFKWWPENYRLESFVDAPTAAPGALGPDKRTGGDPMEILDENPPVYFARNLRNMLAIARENDMGVVLTTNAYCPEVGDYAATAHYRKGFEQHNDIVRQIAAQNNVPLFDFAKQMPRDREYWHDGRHVNAVGSELKAGLFARFLVDNGLLPAETKSAGVISYPK